MEIVLEGGNARYGYFGPPRLTSNPFVLSILELHSSQGNLLGSTEPIRLLSLDSPLGSKLGLNMDT